MSPPDCVFGVSRHRRANVTARLVGTPTPPPEPIEDEEDAPGITLPGVVVEGEMTNLGPACAFTGSVGGDTPATAAEFEIGPESYNAGLLGSPGWTLGDAALASSDPIYTLQRVRFNPPPDSFFVVVDSTINVFTTDVCTVERYQDEDFTVLLDTQGPATSFSFFTDAHFAATGDSMLGMYLKFIPATVWTCEEFIDRSFTASSAAFVP